MVRGFGTGAFSSRFVWFSGLLALYGVFRAPLAMVLEIFRGRKKKPALENVVESRIDNRDSSFCRIVFFLVVLLFQQRLCCPGRQCAESGGEYGRFGSGR